MFTKSGIELVYEGKGRAENGSPLTLQIKKTVKCNEMETFSNQYYTAQSRNMRKSRNILIPTFLTLDIVDNGVTYELLYVNYNSRLYKVKNILKARNTRTQMILDIQEVEQ